MFVRHEPTFEGCLSAVAWCLNQGEKQPVFLPESDEPTLLPATLIETKEQILPLMSRQFTRRLGKSAGEFLVRSYHAFLSEQQGIETRLYRYFYLAWQDGKDPSNRLQDPDIAAVVKAAAKVGREAGRYKGILRFRLLDDTLYCADFSPQCHVLPLIFPHFIDRFQDQSFVICDQRRKWAALYQPGQGCFLFQIAEPAEQKKDPDRANNQPIERLWQVYFSNLSIPERKNDALQRQNIPLSVRRDMTEFRQRDVESNELL